MSDLRIMYFHRAKHRLQQISRTAVESWRNFPLWVQTTSYTLFFNFLHVVAL